MKTSMSDRIARHAQNDRRRIRMIALFACLALVVGTCVEMALRQRGITLTASSEVLDCHVTGKVAHKHSAECYDSNKKLICQLPERELHKHDKTCYSDDGKLVCGKEEITNEHVHGPGCMRTISAPAEDGGKPKTFTHTFKDKSGTPVVRVDVVAPADALPEGTTMRATWLEESQVDKKLVQEAVTKRSGGKVLQMQAMDISFFDADGNEVEPASEVTVKLMSTIISEANAPMVVHVEDQAEAQERAEEQAANAGVADAKAQPKPEGEVMRQLSTQEMALRDESLAKNQIAFETSDFSTYVIATTSLRHTMHASDNATVTIDVDAPVEAGLPADAKLKIDEIPRDSAEYKQYEAQALQVTGEKTSALARFFNIKIMSGDKEIQPDADVSVSVKLNDAPKADVNADAQVVHFGTKPEVVASREEDGTTQFQAKSFSVYGVMYTVDFEYRGLTAVLPGERSMTLSKLLETLGIKENLADITEVTFTNPELLKVEKAGPGATIQRLIADVIAEQEAADQSANAAASNGTGSANEGEAAKDTNASGEGDPNADEGATDEDITVELSTDQDERLVEVPLAEGEDFEPVPDPVQNVSVAEGDWILTSLKSFESEETLTVKTKKTVYEIRVTDPPGPGDMFNPWGPGFGFFGGTANWDLVALATSGPDKATLSVSYDDKKEYAAGDEIVFDFSYKIERKGWSDYNPWMGYPTFTYDASSILKNENFKDLKPGKSYLTFGGKKRGTIEVKADGKIVIQVTDTNWFNTRDEIGGAFTVKLKLSEEGAGHAEGIEFTFPGTTTPVKIPVKVNITSGGKTVVPGETGQLDSDGNYIITYESKVKIPAGLSSLKLVDTMNGKQTFRGLVSVTGPGPNGSAVSGGITDPVSGGQSFTYTFSNPSSLGAGEYTVKYTTVVSKADYNNINGSSWENNTCTWEYNDGKELPGGNTTHEVKNSGGGTPGGGGNQGQNQDQPTVSKTSSVNGQSLGNNVAPGTVIDHTLTIEGKKLAGMQYFDNMTDLQDIVGTPTVKVYEKNGEIYQEKPRAEADKIKNNMQVNAGDSSYHASGTQAISGTVPDEPPFKDDDKTIKIEITYKTRVISQDTATANGIYGQQNVDNSFSENRTWQQHTTSTKVKYEDQPVTKVTKTAALSATAGDNTLASNGTITYTIVVGDGTTTLDGVKIKDYASGDQQIIADSYTIQGSNVNINKADIHPANLPTEPQGWDQTALDFTFPAGTGTGPVTITYQAKAFTDAQQLERAKIYGERNFSNKVTTGTDEATTNVKYKYPEKPQFPITKDASSTDISGGTADKLDPEETVGYTIYFNKDTDSVAGLSIMDEMTDLQKLTGVVNVDIGTATFGGTGTSSDPYTTPQTFTVNNNMNGYGKVGNTVIRIENGVLKYEKSDGTWAEGMPVASYGWADDGVAWSHFDDGSYSENTVRLFNFKFPTEFYTTLEQNGNLTGKTDVVGTVRVTYTTTVITKDEAATSKIMGDKDIKNTVTCNETRKETTEPATFPKNLNHNAAVNKQFNGWDDDGYTTWWTIDIKADEDSSYPLQKLTLTEDWASGSINYSTDWPVQNFNKNVLADIDLLGAQITTDSGVTLQPGRDYTIDKEKGSFYFETLDEPITIRIAIHNPDATINTFYQRNKVKLTWKKDQYNNGEATAEATGRRVKQEVDLTKSGKYDENSRVITWTVIFNPYNKTVVPEWNQIRFEDTMAEGLELTGTIDVHNTGTWQTENISTANMALITEDGNADKYSKFVTQADKDKGIKDVKVSDNGTGKVALITYTDGTSRFVVDDIDPHSQYGNPITKDKYYYGNREEGYSEFSSKTDYDNYVIRYNAAKIKQESELTDDDKQLLKNPPIAEEGIGLGLSDKTYTVTYRTKVSNEEWNKITSSLTGKEVFQNHVTMENDAADAKFEAQNKVTVEGKDYLKKHDVTQEDSDGYIIDEEEIHDNAVSYEVEVNPNKYKVNNGKSLTLTDRIDTIMELDTDSVKVYAVDGDTRTELSNAQLAAQGIAISYNDDTRVLSISGLADQTSYVVAYKAVSRALGSSTFTNTATLVGGGSHSDRVSDQHKITDDDSSFWGNRHGKLELKKIDENDITNKLNDAEFSLYKVRLKNSDETASWTRADWMDLLDKMNSGDPAVLEQIKEQFKQDGEPELLCSGFKSGDDSLFLDDGIVSLEYEEYTDQNPTKPVESTPEHNTFLKEHVVYYWEETKAPTGYKITNPGPHYFVLYIDGELDDDYTKEDQRKKAAWALDDAVSLANGWTVASMSSDSEWKVNDTRDGYTSITATKRWEGDYNDTYETRPKTGILYDLYRVDRVTGQETLMEDLSPVPINDDGSGNWSSYTWYRLDASYNYTVKERAVPGYITTYSDGGKGVEGGKITVTNTYVPKSTDIYVQKKWDPEGGAKPSQVKVSLYKILHRINEDGSTTDEDPEPMGNDFTYMLTAGNGWKHAWKGLDTSDPDGNTISYTVVEDLNAVNESDAVKAARVKYAAVYSDGGQGTVDAPQDDPLTITNLANAAGSLKITKKVTVNGQAVSDTAADGAYRFRITKLNATSGSEEPATYMHGHEDSTCIGETHDQYLVGDVVVQVRNGVASSAMVDNLEEGTYYVYEYEPSGDAKLVSDQRVEVKVLAGVTKEDEAPEAVFINNVDKDRVEVTKRWESANNGVTSWPEGMEVQVKVMKRSSSGELSSVEWPEISAPADWSETETQWLANNRQSYVWDNLPKLEDGESYVVVETAIKNGTANGIVEVPSQTTTTTDGVVTTNGIATITANGTTSSYNVVGERTNAKTEDGQPNTSKGVEYALTNRQVITVPFQKQWGMDGKSGWPQDVQSITIQLYQDGNPLIGTYNGMRILTKEGNSYKAYYTSDGTTVGQEAGTVSDAREVSPALGGGGYNYTFTGLESGHTYTVKEIQVNNSGVNEDTRITANGSYISIQRDGATIRNIDAKETVTIAKAWATGSEPASGTTWEVTGNVTRQRRLYGSTLETAWIADESWNNDTTSEGHTFTIDNNAENTKIAKDLPKYGYDVQTGNIWEYRYSAKETGVTVGDAPVTDAFSAVVAYQKDGSNKDIINSIIVTNSLPKTDVYFRKTWTDGTEEVAWPVAGENETPVTVNLTVTKKQTAYPATGSSMWETDTTWETNGTKTVSVSASAVQKLDNLPKYGYSGGNIVEYKYVVEEATPPTHFTAISEPDADGTAANPYTITNTPPTTSVTVTKKWLNTSTNEYEEWPTGTNGVDEITGTVSRKRREANTSNEYQNDPTYNETFEFSKPDGAAPNPLSNGYTMTIDNLPRYGYEGGTLWEYGYYKAQENQVATFEKHEEGTPQESAAGSFTFTNSRDSLDMNVSVHKQWQDASGGIIQPANVPSNYQSTFELHEVRYAELVVDVPGKTASDNGKVTVRITNDKNADAETVVLDNTRGDGWTYKHSPLLADATYTVSVVGGSDNTTFSTSFANNVNTAPGRTGGTVHIATDIPGPTLTVHLTGLPDNNSGYVAVNIFRQSDGVCMGTIGVSKASINWYRTNKNARDSFPLNAHEQYYAQIASFDANNVGSANISSGGTFTFSSDDDTHTVEVVASAGRPTLTLQAVAPSGQSLPANGSITARITRTFDDGTPSDYQDVTLDSNGWSQQYYLDGYYGHTYTVTYLSGTGSVSGATVTNGGPHRGTETATVTLTPTLSNTPGSLKVRVAAYEGQSNHDGYVSFGIEDTTSHTTEWFSLSNDNLWAHTKSNLDPTHQYQVVLGGHILGSGFIAWSINGSNTSSQVSGSDNSTFDVTVTTTPSSYKTLTVLAPGLTGSDAGSFNVVVRNTTTDTYVASRTFNSSSYDSASGGWKYDFTGLVPDNNYVVSIDNISGFTTVTADSTSVDGNYDATRLVTTDRTPPLSVNVVDKSTNSAFSWNSESINLTVTKHKSGESDSSVSPTLSSSQQSYTYPNDLESGATYDVSISSSNGFNTISFDSSNTTTSLYGLSGNNTHNLTIYVTTGGGNASSIPVTVYWPSGTTQGLVELMNYQPATYQNGQVTKSGGGSTKQVNYGGASQIECESTSNGYYWCNYNYFQINYNNTPSNIYIRCDGGYAITNASTNPVQVESLTNGKQLSNWQELLIPSDASLIEFCFDGTFTAATMIPNYGARFAREFGSMLSGIVSGASFMQPRIALADTDASQLDPRYGIVDNVVTYNSSQAVTVTGDATFTWPNRPKYDSNNNPISYYVVEKSTNQSGYKVADAIYEVNGETYDKDTVENGAIGKTGTFTVTNVDSSTAKIKVRKRFLDVNGNPQRSNAIDNADPRFVLKRYKTVTSVGNGNTNDRYNVRLYYGNKSTTPEVNDNDAITSVSANAGDEIIISSDIADSNISKYNPTYSTWGNVGRTDWKYYIYQVVSSDATDDGVIGLRLDELNNTSGAMPTIHNYSYSSNGSGSITVRLLNSSGNELDSIRCKLGDTIRLVYALSDNNQVNLYRYMLNPYGSDYGYYAVNSGGVNVMRDHIKTDGGVSELLMFNVTSNLVYDNEIRIKLNGDPTFATGGNPEWKVAIDSGSGTTTTDPVPDTDYTGQSVRPSVNGEWKTDEDGPYWEADFPNKVDLTATTAAGEETYYYYVEEDTTQGMGDYSLVSYQIAGGSEVANATATDHQLSGNGTIVVTNQETKATVKVRKQFTDNAGSQLDPTSNAVGSVSTSFTLKRYKRQNSGDYTVKLNAGGSPFATRNCNEGDVLDITWESKSGHLDDVISFYADGSGNWTQDEPRLSASNSSNDCESSATVVKLRVRVDSDGLTQILADGTDGAKVELSGKTKNLHVDHYLNNDQYSIAEITVSGITLSSYTKNGARKANTSDALTPDNNYNGQTISLSLPSYNSSDWNKVDNWLEASFQPDILMTVNGTEAESYVYYVEEATAGQSGGLPAGYEVSYSVDGKAVDPTILSDAAKWLTSSGTVEITNKDQRRTSVTATKQWLDGETDTTKYHQRAGDTVQLTLYRVAGTPSLTTDDYSNLVKPSGNNVITVVPGQNNVPANLKNPVILNVDASEEEPNGAGAGVWTYQWSGLPTTDGNNGENYYKYYVEETVTSVDGTQASYVYKYIDQTSENQDDWKASGVASVTITNNETSVRAVKNWEGGDIANQQHAGESIRLELWRALKERGDHPQTGVSISEDSVTHLVFPHKHEGGDFARFERVPGLAEGQKPAVVSYDFVNRNWNKEWEHLPLVITETEGADSLQVVHTYDVTYYVREVNEKGDEASATYEPTFNLATGLDADKRASGIKSVAITNHETRVEATKKWGVDGSANQAHQNAKVTLELWKAMKAPTGTKGTFDVVEDNTSGLAFPLEHDDGSYVAAVRVDRVTLSYDSALDNNTGGWHKTWENLPKYEEFYGQDYEIVYFVREAETSEGGKTYPASATYVETYNTLDNADSGVASVVITNHDTSVKATKSWVDQSGNDVSQSHQTNLNNSPVGSSDKITLELWKVHKHVGGNYGVSPAENSLEQFPKEVQAGTGNFDAPELVEERIVECDSNNGWDYEWTKLPQYETVDGTTYELAYFVREKSVFTDNDTHSPSPTYGYTGTSAVISTEGVNGGVVSITNHETEVTVVKSWDWGSQTVPGDATATMQLYKARKSLDDTDRNYKVNTSPAQGGVIIFPEKVTDDSGTIASYEPFSDPIVLNTTNTEGKWGNLPLYEVDPETGKTYELEYYVQETATNQPGVTTTYGYEYYDNSDLSKRIKKVTVTNKADEKWSVKVNKYWTGGNAGHEGVTMTLTRDLVPDNNNGTSDTDTFMERTVTLDDGNNWEYTWTGLDAQVTIDDHTYKAARTGSNNDGTYDDGAYGTLVYKVEEKTKDGNNVDRTDFAIGDDDRDSKTPEWPRYQNGSNTDDMTDYWIVTNKPLYYGKLKLRKTFSVEQMRNTLADTSDFATANKGGLKFEITTTDTRLEDVIKQDPKYPDDETKTVTQQELVRTTYYLMHPKSNLADLEWVKEPVQNYNDNGTRKTVERTIGGETVNVAVDEPYEQYKQRYDTWKGDLERNYDYVTYADFTNGEFQILDSKDHTGKKSDNTLTEDLTADRVYDVREINPGKIDPNGTMGNYTLVVEDSQTTGSGSVPMSGNGTKAGDVTETVELSNVYRKVTGTVRVTKKATINDEVYDDVAPGKTFKVGLEQWHADGENGGSWDVVYHWVTTTQTMRLENGETTEITTRSYDPWVQTLTLGTGSEATAVFDGLELGTYRAYELSDGEFPINIHKQAETGEGVQGVDYGLISGYRWEVTETGTYYTYDGTTLSMVDGDGTHVGKDEDGSWNAAGDGSAKVSITGNDAPGTGDSGVVLSAGSEDEKSPRNAEITITNNKTETGSITVEKNLFYNGAPDETKRGKKVKFGLYSDVAAEQQVDNPYVDGTQHYVLDVELGKDYTDSEHYTVQEERNGTMTDVTKTYSASWGSRRFSGLPYKDSEGKDITYYVYEMEKIVEGDVEIWRPVTDGKASLTFDNVTKEYTVVGDSEGRVLEHEDRDQTAKFVNSIKEQGKIKVTKQVFQSDGETLDAEANAKSGDPGAKFKIGLFTARVDDNNTPDNPDDDTTTYALVPGRILQVEIGKDSAGNLQTGDAYKGVGEVTFDKLDFAAGEYGTTYYVFEVDAKGDPVIPVQEVEGSDVLGDYKVSYPRAGITQGFTLTQEKHDYTAETSSGTQDVGATVKNTRNITKADLRILKVDKQSWVDAAAAVVADPTSTATATPLQGATFTLKQLDEEQQFNNDGVAYKPSGIEMTAVTTAEGVATFQDVTTGWYEVKEAASPTGYLVVGDSTVYLKIDNGAVVFLQKEQGVMPKNWAVASSIDIYDATTNPNRNVMSYAAATPAVEADPENNVEAQADVPATATVGNVAGPELPSTGGPGLWPLVYAGAALFAASVVSLALERKRGWEHTA